MNKNLLKQIWNERRSNAFLWMELFVVFIILWYIVDVVYVTLSIYNLPMGFDIENTYVLRFERMTSKAAAYQPGRTMKEYIEYKNKTQEKCNYCTIYQCISGFYKKNVEVLTSERIKKLLKCLFWIHH